MHSNNTLSTKIKIQCEDGVRCEYVTFNTARDLTDIPSHEAHILMRYVELLFAIFNASTHVQDIDNASERVESLENVIDIAIASNDVSSALSDYRARLDELLLVCYYLSNGREDAPLTQDLVAARESSEIEFISLVNDIRS